MVGPLTVGRWFIVSAAAALTTQAPGTVGLKPTLEPGGVARYTITSERTSATTSSITTTKDTTGRTLEELGVRLSFLEPDDEGRGVVEVVIESIRFQHESTGPLTTQQQWLRFDSAAPLEKDATNPAAAAFRPLVGITLRLVIEPDGTIAGMGCEDDLGAIEGESAPRAAALISPPVIRRMLGPIFAPCRAVPEEGVEKGSAWEHTGQIEESQTPGFDLRTRYTVESLENDVATIEVEGGLALSGFAAEIYDVRKSVQSGRLEWDARAGLLRSLTVERASVLDQELGGPVATITGGVSLRIMRTEAVGRAATTGDR